MKAKFRERDDAEGNDDDDDEEEEEEQEQGQGPLALTQGMGEDAKEGVEEEEQAEEAPAKPEAKKRKDKTQPAAQPKGKKIAKPSTAKPTAPATRASTRATTQKAKEQVKEKKKAIEQQGHVQKKPKRRYIAQPESNDEKTESKDISQFRMVSHAPKSGLENICDNVRDNADFSGLKNIELNKLGRVDQNKVEELVYDMMAKFKNTPLELDNAMPKDLYTIVEKKWHYCLKMEKEIRESTLAQVMLELTKGQITKANKKHGSKYAPKYRAFNILQNKIKDVVTKSTQMWKLIYGLTTVKEGEEDPFEEKNNGEDEDETEKEKGDNTVVTTKGR